MLLLAPFFVMAAVAFNVEASSLPYYNPQDSDRTSFNYRLHGSGSIPRVLGEKLLSNGGHTYAGDQKYAADSLIVLVNRDFAIVRERLHQLVQEKIGIAEEYDNIDGTIPPFKEHNPDFLGEDPSWPPLRDGLTILNNPGTIVTPPREYQLTSRPYNQRESVKGHSVVQIRVTDGKDFFGKNVTVLQIRRRDYSREWARSAHIFGGALVLPYKENLQFHLVTDTEVALIEQLTKRVPEMIVRYFVPPPRRGLFYMEAEDVTELLASMREATKQF